MRKPDTIEQLYLDFDGFFASVEQQCRPGLRGRPVAVVPFEGAVNTCVIAASKEAKARGVKSVMPVREARQKCRDLILIAQSPDLYRRAHNALLAEISAVIPIDAIKSIDELTCRLQPRDIAAPEDLCARIKTRLRDNIGPYITCSIGLAANRQLAKIACKMDKPDGLTIWQPDMMPGPLLPLPFEDIPGIGRRMELRLYRAGIGTMKTLLATQPKQLRKIWNNVTGERLWYALHGYDVQAGSSQRGMYGHGRVLPPGNRSLDDAQACARLLLVKAARRMRRDGYYAGKLWLWLSRFERGWSAEIVMPIVRDDQAILAALAQLWRKARARIGPREQIFRVGVTLLDLSRSDCRQLDIFIDDDAARQKWETVNAAVDAINTKYSRTLVSMGPWAPPPGGYAGGKISYTRIPKAEDFW